MARVLVDDLDQTVHTEETPVHSWHFAFGPAGEMTTYTVDLTEKNYEKLVSALQPFIDIAGTEEVKRDAPLGVARRVSAGKGRTKEIREWARANGHEVSDRGRIPESVQEAYRLAQ